MVLNLKIHQPIDTYKSTLIKKDIPIPIMYCGCFVQNISIINVKLTTIINVNNRKENKLQ